MGGLNAGHACAQLLQFCAWCADCHIWSVPLCFYCFLCLLFSLFYCFLTAPSTHLCPLPLDFSPASLHPTSCLLTIQAPWHFQEFCPPPPPPPPSPIFPQLWSLGIYTQVHLWVNTVTSISTRLSLWTDSISTRLSLWTDSISTRLSLWTDSISTTLTLNWHACITSISTTLTLNWHACITSISTTLTLNWHACITSISTTLTLNWHACMSCRYLSFCLSLLPARLWTSYWDRQRLSAEHSARQKRTVETLWGSTCQLASSVCLPPTTESHLRTNSLMTRSGCYRVQIITSFYKSFTKRVGNFLHSCLIWTV